MKVWWGPLTALTLAFSSAVYSAPVPFSKIQKRNEQIWSGKYESTGKRILLGAPRSLFYLLKSVIGSASLHRVTNLGKGANQLLQRKWNSARHTIAQSPTNVLADIHDIFSDSAAIFQTPFVGWARQTPRIQVCRTNLGPFVRIPRSVEQIMPAYHIAFLIDGIEESADGGGGHGILQEAEEWGLYCKAAPVLKNESDSLVIEKLRCMNDRYSRTAAYSIFKYNCGGYSRDLLRDVGLGFLGFPNWGVGAHFQIGVEKNRMDEAKAYCAEHIIQLKEMIWRLDAAAPLSESTIPILTKELREMFDRPGHDASDGAMAVSHDVLLQLIVSAARGKNEENRKKIRSIIHTDWFTFDYYKDGKIKSANKKSLNEIIWALDKESLDWLSVAYPRVLGLHNELQSKPKAAARIQNRKG